MLFLYRYRAHFNRQSTVKLNVLPSAFQRLNNLFKNHTPYTKDSSNDVATLW